MAKGRFYVLEGGDGAGKATQAKRLHNFLPQGAYLYSFPRYDTPIGQVIKRHLRKEIMLADGIWAGDNQPRRAPEDALVFQCLMLADKIEAGYLIAQHLSDGHSVVADRWWPSAYAYGGSDGLSDDWLLAVHALLPVPDRYVLLDLDPELAIERVVKRAAVTGRVVDRYETVDRQARVRARYLELASKDADRRWRVIDASSAENEVAVAVLAAVVIND